MMVEHPGNNPIPGTSGMMNRLLDRTASSRKRSMDDQPSEVKRPRYSWFVKLESESSSLASEDDTESVYSIQGYETELVQDTPDTDTKSEYSSSSDVDFEVEYEVDDASGDEENPFLEDGSSSETEDVLAAAGAIAAVMCDSSMEAWLTDGEDSDTSSVDDIELNRTDFWTCIQCKSQNNNPLFRYCQKCFQIRKTLFPPRPRGHRKRQRKTKMQSKKIGLSVQQNTVECSVNPGVNSQDSDIGSLDSRTGSQDSGIGSQDSIAESHKSAFKSQDSGILSGQSVRTYDLNIASTSKGVENGRGVKRESSSAVEDEHLASVGGNSSKRSRTNGNIDSGVGGEANSDTKNTSEKTQNQTKTNETSEFAKPEERCNGVEQEVEFVRPADVTNQSEGRQQNRDRSLCIMCESELQNSVFVHSSRGCLCCCYKCAIRTWKTHKKCPACTRKVKNIIRINAS